MARIFNPTFIPLLLKIPNNIANIIAIILAMLFAADFSTTIAVLIDFDDQIANAEERLENKIGSIVNNVLDEKHPIKDKFYDAVDKASEVPGIAKEKLVNVKNTGYKESQKIINKTKKFSHKTIERVKTYRHNIKILYSWKDKEVKKDERDNY